MPSAESILIIGATRGIGLGLIQQALLTHPIATIFATARDPTKATHLLGIAEKSHGRVQILTADAIDVKSLQAAAEAIKKTHTALDIIIYNAGISEGFGNILEIGIEGLKDNINTNLYGAYYAATAFVPMILKSNYVKKSFLLITSTFGSMALSGEILAAHEKIQGKTGYDATAMYNISKTALNRLGIELDHALRRQGVPVLLVHPGIVKTDMNPFGGIEVEESASGIMKVADSFASTAGKNFVGWNGEELPW